MAYLLVVIFPAGLLALYALFRWRYVAAIKNTIYPPIEVEFDTTPRAVPRASVGPLAVNQAAQTPPSELARAELAQALAITQHVRSRLLASGVVFLLLAALIAWYGQRLVWESRAAAAALAYSSTLPSIFVILAFFRPNWRTWLLVGIAWAVAGFLLLAGPFDVPWRNAIVATYAAVDTTSYALVAILLVTLRRTRTLLAGFVPLIGVWFLLTMLFMLLLRALGLNAEEVLAAASGWLVSLALVALALGIWLAVRQIRRGLTVRFLLALVAMLAVGVADGLTSRHLMISFMMSIALNATFVVLLWYVFGGFLRLKTLGFMPDELLHFSFCWLAWTILFPFYAGRAAPGWALVPLTAYAVTLFVLLSRYRRRMARQSPKRMLLLRVFSRTAMRTRLLDLLDDSWRRVGRIDLVVGVDLAVRTLGAAALENFLLGRVDRQFVRSTTDVNRHLSSLRSDVALDARYPLNELHCLPDVWQHVVTGLARAADVVLMDLRGFQARNRGVVYELSIIMSRVPLARTVLLTDKDTDMQTLNAEMLRAWSQVLPDSPNVGLAEPRVELLHCSGRRSADAQMILDRVFAAGSVKDLSNGKR